MDFLAGSVELFGLWKVGSGKRWGFLFGALCNALWITHVLTSRQSWGLLLVVVPALAINLRNWRAWR